QAEESKQKQEQAQAKVEGVNKPSAEHEIDIYV
ncbi:FlxA protein, partial [Leclercia adecarboxylata]